MALLAHKIDRIVLQNSKVTGDCDRWESVPNDWDKPSCFRFPQARDPILTQRKILNTFE